MGKQNNHTRVGIALLSLLAGTAFTAPAVAGKAQAELVCGYQQSTKSEMVPLPSKQLKRLDGGLVGCAVRVKSVTDPGGGISVSIRTARKAKDAQTGKIAAVEGPDHSDVLLNAGEDSKPMMADLKPVNAKGVGDWEPCGSFDIVATVTNDYSKVLWKKKLKIKQTCPKPKPLSVDVTCTAKGADGGSVSLPDKSKPRLAKDDIECQLESQTQAMGVARVTVESSWKIGKEKRTSGALPVEVRTLAPSGLDSGEEPPPDAFLSTGSFTLAPGSGFDVCAPSTALKIIVTSDDGQVIGKKSVKFQQRCPKPKPLKAKLSCSLSSPDGLEVKLPSAKLPRLGDAVSCVLASGDERLAKAEVTYRTAWDSWESGSKSKKTGGPHKADGVAAEGDDYLRQFQLAPGDFEECSGPLVLQVTAQDADGQALFAKKLTFKQRCDD